MKLIFTQHNIEQVYHIGGQAYLDVGESNPYYDVDVNIKGMINLLKLCREYDARMVFTSTGAVYGQTEVPHKEDSPCNPMSNYGCSKLSAETYLKKYSATEGVDARIVRFSSIYGEGRKAGPVNIFLRLAHDGKPLLLNGGGMQTRDYVYVEDVCDGMMRVMEYGRRGEVYNLGYGEERTVRDVADIVHDMYPDTVVKTVSGDYNLYDVQRSWFNIDKAKKLGYNPRYDLELGIRYTDMKQTEALVNKN